MSTTTTTAPAEGQDQGGSSGYTPPASQAELDKIIADRLSRERGKFADYDELKTKAAEYDKGVDASKTETQKAIDRADAAEAKVATFEAKAQVADWAADITKDSAVPPDALRGSTREELEAHHTQLASLITGKPAIPKPATPPGKSPAERGGATGSRAAEAVRAYRARE